MNLQFFQLAHALKGVGIYPQANGMIKEYDFNAGNSVIKFAEMKGIYCPFSPNLDSFKLHHKAKLTDVISGCIGPGHDLVISKKFFELLITFKLGPHQVFSASLDLKGIKQGYFWIHFLYQLEKDAVVYNRSVFDYGGNIVKGIDSYEDYIRHSEKEKNYGMMTSKVTYLKANAITDLDIFTIGWFNQKVYVSERLKSAILSAKISGIEFFKVDDLHVI